MSQGRQGQATEPTKSARLDQLPSVLGSGAGLVGGVLAAGGRACQHRPARSLHPWAWWEKEAPTTRAACRPVPGHSRCDLRDPVAPWRDVRAFSAEARGRGELSTAAQARVRTVTDSGGRAKGG
jgi:hypothetical protein